MNTFSYDGFEYLINPNISELVEQSGLSENNSLRVIGVFEKASITRLMQLQTMTKKDLSRLLNDNKQITDVIFNHIQFIKHRGHIIKTGYELKEIENSYQYLRTPTASLDMMLNYSNGENGLRTQSVIEIYGPAGIGKTQFCMSQAIIALKEWKCTIGYIDSEGAFEFSRFTTLGKYYGLETEYLSENIFVSKITNFDDLEFAMVNFEKIIKDKNIRLIIIDSIIDPLKNQYPVGGEDMKNLQPRQQHLKKVIDMMKSISRMYNIIIIYTNQVRIEIGSDKTVPQGGNVLSHASDVRISLEQLPQSEEFIKLGLKHCRATIVDCGFLANLSGEYIISPMGIVDQLDIKDVVKHTEKINKMGYLCIDQNGDVIDQ